MLRGTSCSECEGVLGTQGGEPSESSSSTSSKQEGHKGSHRRSRSAGIVKDLFTRISGLSKWSEDSY